jgi:hypothetical protein
VRISTVLKIIGHFLFKWVFVGPPRMVITTYHIFPDARNKHIYALWVGISTVFKILEQLRLTGPDHSVWSWSAYHQMLFDTRGFIHIDYLLFDVPLKNFSLILRRQHFRWRAAEFRPLLGAQQGSLSTLLITYFSWYMYQCDKTQEILFVITQRFTTPRSPKNDVNDNGWYICYKKNLPRFVIVIWIVCVLFPRQGPGIEKTQLVG